MNHLFTDISGWIVLAILATTLSLPFLLRRDIALVRVGGSVTVMKRMRPHFWLGFSLFPLAFVHLWPAMSAGWVRQADATGLYLATIAWLLLPVQVLLGFRLRNVAFGRRPGLRRMHFWTMVTISVLALGHVVLNTPAIRAFVG